MRHCPIFERNIMMYLLALSVWFVKQLPLEMFFRMGLDYNFTLLLVTHE